MAIVPEDGTGLANAESYVTLAEANAYFVARAEPSGWSGDDVTDEQRESALRYATVDLDARYQWSGVRLTTTQALEWPRSGAVSLDGAGTIFTGVPQLVKDAQCELALIHLTAALNAVLARGGQIESASLGPMSVKFAGTAPAESSMPYLDRLLRRIGTPRSLPVGGSVQLYGMASA